MNQPLDERELASLIRAHSSALFAIARAFTEEDADAEDILQEVWMIAARSSHRRAAGAPIRAWLCTVTLNGARSYHRKVERRRWLTALWSSEIPLQHDESRAPSLAIELQHAALWRAVAALPSLQRDTVLLRIVEDLSTRDVAVRMHRAEGTVKVSLHRALARLRRVLDPPSIHDQDQGESP